jgi:hypothetical protein
VTSEKVSLRSLVRNVSITGRLSPGSLLVLHEQEYLRAARALATYRTRTGKRILAETLSLSSRRIWRY